MVTRSSQLAGTDEHDLHGFFDLHSDQRYSHKPPERLDLWPIFIWEVPRQMVEHQALSLVRDTAVKLSESPNPHLRRSILAPVLFHSSLGPIDPLLDLGYRIKGEN